MYREGSSRCEDVEDVRKSKCARQWTWKQDFKNFHFGLWIGYAFIFSQACASRVLINYCWQLDWSLIGSQTCARATREPIRGPPWREHITTASPAAGFGGFVCLSPHFLICWQNSAGCATLSCGNTVLSLTLAPFSSSFSASLALCTWGAPCP